MFTPSTCSFSLPFIPPSFSHSFLCFPSLFFNEHTVDHTFFIYTKQVLLWKQFSDKLSVRFKLISSVKKKLHLRPLRQTKDVCRDRATDLKS